jgi:hypothetical protein
MNRFFILTLVITILLFSTGVFAYSTTTSLPETGNAISELSDLYSFSGKSAHLQAAEIIPKDGSVSHEGRVRILFNGDLTLGQISTLSWKQYVTQGYPSHIDILLDVDGNGVFESKKDLEYGLLGAGMDDVLVAEFAYNPMSHYDRGAPYTVPGDLNNWIDPFNDGGILTDATGLWLYSACPGAPGSPDFLFDTLSNWKVGKTRTHQCYPSEPGDGALINSDTKVYGIEIEVDGWIRESEAYIDDVVLNGELLEDFEGTQGSGGVIGTDFTFLANPDPLDFGTIIAGHSGVAVSTLTVGASNLVVQEIAVNPVLGDVFNEANVLFSQDDGVSYMPASTWIPLVIPHDTSDELYVKLTIPAGTHSGDFSGQIVYTVMEESLP